jgi:hypothetical protein
MTYPQAAPPPQIPASQLRPGRAWYWVAGVIAVLGICVGGVIGVIGFSSLVDDVPRSLDAEFDPGSPVTLDLSADQTWAIFVSREQGSTDVGTECTGSPANGGSIDLNRSDIEFRFGTGDRTWRLIYDVEVSETGRYQIECRVTDATVTDARFGIAESVNVGNIVGQVFGSLGALLGIPCLALTVAGIIAVVTAVRRNSHKKRLQQERGYLPPGGPGFGQQPPGVGHPQPSGYQAPGGSNQTPSGGYPPPPPGAPPASGPQPPSTTQE